MNKQIYILFIILIFLIFGLGFKSFSQTTIFSDDFESGTTKWTGWGGDAEWERNNSSDIGGGEDPSSDHSTSGTYWAGNSLYSGGYYSNNISDKSLTSISIDCSNYSNVSITAWWCLSIEGNSYDDAYFEVYNGSTWTVLYNNPSSSQGQNTWSQHTYDISSYVDGVSNAQIRFRLNTDGGEVWGGWNIDDITITGTPNYSSEWISMDIGDAEWCPGETRSVTVTVKNDGLQSWTSGGGSGNVNLSYWWTTGQTHDSNTRIQPFSGLGSGSQQVITFDITAPATSGTNTLNFDLVKELDCWFRLNTSSCGPGNVIYTSVTQTIMSDATAPTTISGTTNICTGNSTSLSVSGGTTGTSSDFHWFTSSCPSDMFTQEWDALPYTTPNTTVNNVNGILNVTSISNDPMINMESIGSFDPTTYKYIQIRYKVTAGTAGSAQIFFTNTGYPAANGAQYVQSALTSDNAWHILTIDMSVHTNWTNSNIKGWRFDWCTAPGVTMDIDYISLSSSIAIDHGTSINVSPTSNITYYVLRSGMCNNTSCANNTVTVDPTSVGGSISGGTTPICDGIATGTMTLSGHTGSITKWQKQVDAGAWVDIANTTTTYSETPSSLGDWDYRAVITSGVCSSTNSAPRSITVSDAISGGGISSNQTICTGGDPVAFTNTTLPSGGNGTWAYQWQKSTGSWTDISGATSSTYDPPTGLTENTQYRRKETNNCGTLYSNTVTVSVDATPDLGTITISSTNVCQGDPVTVSRTGGNGTLFHWCKNPDDDPDWNVFSGATGESYQYTLVGAGYHKWLTHPNNGACGWGGWTHGHNEYITVDVTSVGGSISGGNTPICNGLGTGTMTLSGYNGTIEKWQKQVDGGGWSDIANTNTTYSETPSSEGFWEYRAVVRNGSVCSTANSTSQTIVVQSFSTAATAINITNNNTCYGTSKILSPNGGSLGSGASWKWYTSSCGGTLVGTGNTYNANPTTSTQYWVEAEGICNTTTACVNNTVIVKTESTDFTALVSDDDNTCPGATITLIPSGGIDGSGATYNWYSASCGGTSLGTGTTLDVSPIVSTTYYVRKEGDCNTTSCESIAITVKVESTAPASITATSNPICTGSSTTLTLSGGISGTGSVYQWYSGSCGGTYVGATTSQIVSPATTTTYYARRFGDCNTTPCANISITVHSGIPIGPLATAGSGMTSTQFIANWNSVAEVTTYYLDASENISFSSFLSGYQDLDVGNVLSKVVTGLTENTDYYYKVRAGNSCGISGSSNTILVRTIIPDMGLFIAGNFTNNGTFEQGPSDYVNMTGSSKDILGTNGYFKDVNLIINGGDIDFNANTMQDALAITNVYEASTLTVLTDKTFRNKEFTNLTGVPGGILNLNAGSFFENYEDWTNHGTVNANATSTVTFNGEGSQEVKSGGSSFANIIFNQTVLSTIDLQDDMEINTSAIFTNGIVSFANPLLKVTLGSSATCSVGNANSFADGIVEKTDCSDPIILPTGNIINRDLGLAGDPQIYKIWAPIGLDPGASTTTVNARYNFSNQGLHQWWYTSWTHHDPLTHTSNREYWLVNSGSALKATLYWNNNDPCSIHDFCEPGPVFNSEDLTIAYWDGIWIDAGGTASSNYISGEITSEIYIPLGTKSERQITFGAKNSELPLPIELTCFRAACDDKNAIIELQTASETNNDYFILEKSNGEIEFYEIARLQGAGNSNELVDYHFVDDDMFAGDNYYRLKQVDIDCRITTYNVISLNCDEYTSGQPNMYAFPNPFTNELNVVIENLETEAFVLEIFDDLGRIVYKKQYSTESSYFNTIIDLQALRPAVYNLRSTSVGGVMNLKVVKK